MLYTGKVKRYWFWGGSVGVCILACHGQSNAAPRASKLIRADRLGALQRPGPPVHDTLLVGIMHVTVSPATII